MIAALSGCWSSIELNERAFARILMLDKTENGIELSLGFPLPNRLAGASSAGSAGGSGGSSSGQPFSIITKTGGTIGEAYQNIQTDLARRITFGQLRHILISKALAREGLLSLIDFINRNTEVHINANMFVTEGPAKEMGQIPMIFERFPTDILTAYAKQRSILIVTAKDVIEAILVGGDFVLPMMRISGTEKWMGMSGAALFRQGKMENELSLEEMRTAMWIAGKTGRTTIHSASPTDGKKVSFNLYGLKTTIKPVVNGDRIRFIIYCRGAAQAFASESLLDLTDRRQLASLQKSLNRDMQNRIRQTIARSQAEKADVFGLGPRLKWKSPATWKRLKANWRDVYQDQIVVEPRVEIQVKWFGGAQKPKWNQQLTEQGERE